VSGRILQSPDEVFEKDRILQNELLSIRAVWSLPQKINNLTERIMTLAA